MQDMVNFEGFDTKKTKDKKIPYRIGTLNLLKNKDFRVTFYAIILIFLISSVGISFLSDAVLSIVGFDDMSADVFSPYVYTAVSLFVEYTFFAFSLFPFVLGIYAYALSVVNMQNATVDTLFFYYKDRKRYFFAVRYAYFIVSILVVTLFLSYFVSRLGIEFASTFEAQADIARATVLLFLSLLCILTLFVFAVIRFCDCFAVVSLSLCGEYSLKNLCRISLQTVKGSRKTIVAFGLYSVFWISVSILSAGLLAPYAMARVFLSRALLDKTILNEYKTKTIYNQKFSEVNDGK